MTQVLNFPRAAKLASDGTAYVADQCNHRIARVIGSKIETVAGGNQAGHRDGKSALFNYPSDVVVAPNGSLIVADTFNHAIREITLGKEVTVNTLAGNGKQGLSDDPQGAAFCHPWAVAVEKSGAIVVADRLNGRIRRLISGRLQTLHRADGKEHASFNEPCALDIGADGTIYVAEFTSHRILAIAPSPTGTDVWKAAVTTFAGVTGEVGSRDGRANQATFHFPAGLSVGPSNSLYVADYYNNKVRRIEKGEVSTVATPELLRPEGVTYCHKSGELIIVDTFNHRLVRVGGKPSDEKSKPGVVAPATKEAKVAPAPQPAKGGVVKGAGAKAAQQEEEDEEEDEEGDEEGDEEDDEEEEDPKPVSKGAPKVAPTPAQAKPAAAPAKPAAAPAKPAAAPAKPAAAPAKPAAAPVKPAAVPAKPAAAPAKPAAAPAKPAAAPAKTQPAPAKKQQQEEEDEEDDEEFDEEGDEEGDEEEEEEHPEIKKSDMKKIEKLAAAAAAARGGGVGGGVGGGGGGEKKRPGKGVESWSPSEVLAWLKSNKLSPTLVEQFEEDPEAAMSGEELLIVDSTFLSELGIKEEERDPLLEAIAKLK